MNIDREISEGEIRSALAEFSSCRATPQALARVLECNLATVLAALTEFEREGLVGRKNTRGVVYFYMANNPPRDLPYDERVTFEAERAEALWKKRMGTKRWRDDPRSLAEAQKHPEIFHGRITGGYEVTLGGVSSVYG
jgi:DNA-binding transcriptional regulator YhcF (GntR family)